MRNSLKITLFGLSFALAGAFNGCVLFGEQNVAEKTLYCDGAKLISKETQSRFQSYKDEAQRLKDDSLYNDVLLAESEWESRFYSHLANSMGYGAARCNANLQAYKEIMQEVGTKDIENAKGIKEKLKAEALLRNKIADRGIVLWDKRKQNK